MKRNVKLGIGAALATVTVGSYLHDRYKFDRGYKPDNEFQKYYKDKKLGYENKTENESDDSEYSPIEQEQKPIQQELIEQEQEPIEQEPTPIESPIQQEPIIPFNSLNILKTLLKIVFPNRNSDDIFKNNTISLLNLDSNSIRNMLFKYPMVYFYFLAIYPTLTTAQDISTFENEVIELKKNSNLMFYVRFLAKTKLKQIHELLFEAFKFYKLDYSSIEFYNDHILKSKELIFKQDIDRTLSRRLIQTFRDPMVKIIQYNKLLKTCNLFFNVENILEPLCEFQVCNDSLDFVSNLYDYITTTPNNHTVFYDEIIQLTYFKHFESFDFKKTFQGVVTPDKFPIDITISSEIHTVFIFNWLYTTKREIVVENKILTLKDIKNIIDSRHMDTSFLFTREFYFYFSPQEIKEILNIDISDILLQLIYSEMSRFFISKDEMNKIERQTFLSSIKQFQTYKDCILWEIKIVPNSSNYEIFQNAIHLHKAACNFITDAPKNLIRKDIFEFYLP